MRRQELMLWLIAFCLLSLAGCDKQRARVPKELIGSWTTDVPAYRDRALKLEAEYVLIGFGEDVTPTVQRVTQVETLKLDTGNTYTIHSTDKDGPHQITVYFDPKEPTSLFLKNLPGKWHKS
jgi:hypothetical protein